LLALPLLPSPSCLSLKREATLALALVALPAPWGGKATWARKATTTTTTTRQPLVVALAPPSLSLVLMPQMGEREEGGARARARVYLMPGDAGTARLLSTQRKLV